MEVKEQGELEWCKMFTASYNHDVSHGTSVEHQKDQDTIFDEGSSTGKLYERGNFMKVASPARHPTNSFLKVVSLSTSCTSVPQTEISSSYSMFLIGIFCIPNVLGAL